MDFHLWYLLLATFYAIRPRVGKQKTVCKNHVVDSGARF